MCVVGEEILNTCVYAHIDTRHCYVITDQLLRAVTLIGQPPPAATTIGSGAVVGVASSVISSRTSKLLRIVAFGPALPSAFEYTVRIYVVMDTSDALQASRDDVEKKVE